MTTVARGPSANLEELRHQLAGRLALALLVVGGLLVLLTWPLIPSVLPSMLIAAVPALALGRPDIFNSDQGAQFTAQAFTSRLEAAAVRISMDGRGRALDNVFVERLWRSVKYEHVYLHDYVTGLELEKGLEWYFTFYNTERPHQSLGYRTPAALHFGESISSGSRD